MVIAYVEVSASRAKALRDANQPVPNPVQIRGLVDTGASCTCIDPKVLTDLGLTPTGTTTVITAGNLPEEREQYDVTLIIPGATQGDPALEIDAIPVVASKLLDIQGFHALIGRDVLGTCVMNYNGTMRTFTIAY